MNGPAAPPGDRMAYLKERLRAFEFSQTDTAHESLVLLREAVARIEELEAALKPFSEYAPEVDHRIESGAWRFAYYANKQIPIVGFSPRRQGNGGVNERLYRHHRVRMCATMSTKPPARHPMTMLEKCARAAHSKCFEGLLNPMVWEGLTRQTREAWFRQVRAVLAAMREPDEAMIEAGASAAFELNSPEETYSQIATATFQAMIDKAMEE